MLLKCGLIHIGVIFQRNFLHLKYLHLCLLIGLIYVIFLAFAESKKPFVLSDLTDNSGFSDYCSCFSASLIRNIGQFGAKNILQTIEQLIQFSFCSYKKEIFRVYSFSEQVAAKGNSPEVT